MRVTGQRCGLFETTLRLSFRAPLFGARNLLFRDSKQLRIPRYARNDHRAEYDCAGLK
jgi:hypothetical protein